MLKQRVITGLIAAVLVIASILWLPPLGVSALFAVFTLIAAWEWANLAGVKAGMQRGVYLMVIAALLVLFLELPVMAQLVVCSLAVLWWLLVSARMDFGVQPRALHGEVSVLWLLAGVLTLVPAFVAVTYLHRYAEPGRDWLLFVLGIAPAADIGAYFAGKRWGKTKLAAAISPGKTREGAVGGLLAVAVYALVGMVWLQIETDVYALFFIALLLATPLSIVGDLFESWLKRAAGQKDSGVILPGHGGMLDRIDSMTVTAPFMVLVHALLTHSSGLLGGWT